MKVGSIKQGSTYKQVIMNVRNMNLCKSPKERKRLLYTGVTRASELLILFNVWKKKRED